MTQYIAPTNQAVAERIAMTHSGVSRLRSGHRNPSIVVMRAIEREYGWKVSDQIEAMEAGTFHSEFEAKISVPEEADAE